MTPLFFAFAFLLVILLVYMGKYSGRLHVEQKRLIAAPVEQVYAEVLNLTHWAQWVPWLVHEPHARISCPQAAPGPGASFAWEGERIGSAELRVLRCVDPRQIEHSFKAHRPFKFQGRCVWTFTEKDGMTEVTWAFSGRVGFVLRLFASTVRELLSLDFRYGLDRLAQRLEPAQGPHISAHYTLTYLGVRREPERRYVYETYKGPFSGIAAAMREAYARMARELTQAGVQVKGDRTALYLQTNIKLKTTHCQMAFPVASAAELNAAQLPASLPERELPAHSAYVVQLQGPYGALEVAWVQTMQRVRIEGLKPDQRVPPYERYLNDPTQLPPQEWLTELVIPLT